MILSDYHFISVSMSKSWSGSGSVSVSGSWSGSWSGSRYGSWSESSKKIGLTDQELVIQKVLDE